MSEPRTVGEAVEEEGYSELMLAVVELAERCGRVPVGQWAYRFTSEPRWRLYVNGGDKDWTPEGAMTIPRFHALLERDGWPVALVNAASGTIMGVPEEVTIAAVQRETELLLKEIRCD